GVGDAGALDDLRGDGVNRERDRIGNADIAAIFVLVVARLPLADGDTVVVEMVAGVQAVIERRGVNDGFEGRAGLAQRLSGAVELASLIIAAADHRANRAV